MDRVRRATPVLACVVFLVAAIVYLTTQYPTVPFWDSGEFIAVSKILGIPHPPGTPFYVLIGRIATMVPWASVAERVNALSSIAAALAVMLTYLTIVRLARIAQGANRTTLGEVLAHVAGITGALMLAFSDSFWENSTEAEVYALMSLAQILVLWLGLKWWEEHERKPTAGLLLLSVYVIWLSVGLHLGVALMALPLLILVTLVDRRTAWLFGMPLISALAVTQGLQVMAGVVLLLGTIVFIRASIQRKLAPEVVYASAGAALVGVVVAFTDFNFNVWTSLIAVAGLLVPLVAFARGHREGRILALAVFLMVAGYSTHVYLPIRAAQHPAINEGDPSNWPRLRDLLERKQYGQMNMFVRRAPWSVQLDKEFWRYFSRQWPLLPEGRPFGSALPIVLGLAGAAWLALRNPTSFLATGAFVSATTVGMILFLNFSPNEVRERDYFFQSGYHAYSIWIGLGVAWLAGWIGASFAQARARTMATAATAILLALMPLLMLRNLWRTHDRRGNYVAYDYARNMLAPLAPNSYVFTNGDNDTFPLWYMQEVEGFRKDVRVVNLSLLNTDWYIRQLRDEEPKVPIALDDRQVDVLGYGAIQDEQGRLIYTNQFMVGHILEQSRVGADSAASATWKKQPYFAVTVPEHMGMDQYFSLEGLVYRVNRDTLQDEIDVEATRKALYETFQYRGLFTADGAWDSTVYKDENASILTRNYAAAHIQLAYEYRRSGDMPRAIAEMERVARMFPDYIEVQIPLGGFYMDVGDTARAEQLFSALAAREPNHPEVRYYHGITRLFRGDVDTGVRELEAAIQLQPGFQQAYYAAYFGLNQAGRREQAIAYLERWLRVDPNDPQARMIVQSARGQGMSPAIPPPPPVNLP